MRMFCWRLLVVMGVGMLCGMHLFSAEETLTEDDLRWREKMGWNEQVHGPNLPKEMRDLIARVPYAFYPYTNQLEVLFDYSAAVKLLPKGTEAPANVPDKVTVRVLPADGEKVLWSGDVGLDARGRGLAVFDLPALPKGVFRVEYVFGGATLKAARSFSRSYFEFEHNTIGRQHEVYPPFTPVEVKGSDVSVVGRTCRVNALGLFDSVVSQGRELLAAPIALRGAAPVGPIQWRAVSVKGKASYPDLAEFECRAESAIGSLTSKVSVEEDGCARVKWTLSPAAAPVRVDRLWIEIALKESEAPLFHFAGMNSMRHNYAGAVPRGGTVTWYNQPWRPARFEVAPFEGKGPDSYEVWNATQVMHWGGERWNFAPYVWLGAEERGLAWFGDHTRGYETDGARGIQRLSIEPGRVVLRIELIQRPVLLDSERRFEFGLQASPTKPMPEGWRGYDVPGGGGMQVNVWGGYNCAWHYPDPKDWRIVEKIVSARGAKVDPNWDEKAFRAFFEELDKQRQFPDLMVHGRKPWLEDVLGFAGRVGHPNGVTVYYEEFQTSGHHPEAEEYMDEWDMDGWCRYRKFEYAHTNRGKQAWGPQARTANQESWRDFAVYYADQWMSRGVGIYYDNTYPSVERNPFNLRDAGTPWSSGIWGHRDYFRRVWKRSRELMAKGLTPLDPLYQQTDPTRRMRLHTVGHVTNCQVLPYTTWWDATLGVEAPGQWIPHDKPSAEQVRKQVEERGFVIMPTPRQGAEGQALPYPPDYLRAMEMGRMAGLIPHYRHLLRSEDAFGGLGISYGATDQGKDEAVRAHRLLSDKAMGLVHEIRGGASGWDHPEVRAVLDALKLFGYGGPGTVVHNYWADPPFVRVGNPHVKWIALERDRQAGPLFGLLLLQSYLSEATETTAAFPGAGAMLDVLTRKIVPVDRPVALPADYGTRLLLAAPDEAALKPLVWADDVVTAADFGFGLPPGWRSHGSGAPGIAADPADPANRLLRVTPGHPSQNYVQGRAGGDYELSFRFRLPAAEGKPPHKQVYGLLQVLHRWSKEWPKQTGYTLSLGVAPGQDGVLRLSVGYQATREGEAAAFADVRTDRLKGAGEAVPVDTAWHVVRVRVTGNRHMLTVDDQLLFDGESDVSGEGFLRFSPGWGSWTAGLPHVDVDDIVIRKK